MILDHLSRAEKYYNIHTSFRRAFDFLKATDLRSLPLGKTIIEGEDIYLIVAQDKTGNERRKLETHSHYIDIQLPIQGSFPLEWHDEDSCKNVFTEYDKEKDITLYSDPPLFTVHLIPDMFAILFPEDAHAPQPPMTDVTKIIIKVAV